MAHTSWSVSDSLVEIETNKFLQVSDDYANRVVAYIPYSHVHRNSHKEAAGDARLIAAAPTMYALLERRAEQGDREAAEFLETIHVGR
jgi:hypothetical protein